MMTALSSRVHTYARPEARESMISFFTDVLGCEALASGDVKDPSVPIVAFRFTNGSPLSVEFTDDALG